MLTIQKLNCQLILSICFFPIEWLSADLFTPRCPTILNSISKMSGIFAKCNFFAELWIYYVCVCRFSNRKMDIIRPFFFFFFSFRYLHTSSWWAILSSYPKHVAPGHFGQVPSSKNMVSHIVDKTSFLRNRTFQILEIEKKILKAVTHLHPSFLVFFNKKKKKENKEYI